MSEEISDTIPDACPGTQSELAGKSSACDGCPNQKFCASGTSAPPDPAVEQVAKCFENVNHKIIVLSGKGGVGKSSFTVHLSRALALNSDVQVSILDIDICGPSIPHMMGVGDQQIHQSNSGWAPVMVDDNLSVMSVGFMLENLDVAVIWRGPKKNGIIKKFLLEVNWGELSYLIIDTPPGTSDEHLSIVQYLADAKVDGAIIVTTPQEVSLVDVRKEINFCKKTGIPIIGVVENMAGFTCPKCKKSTDIFSPSTGGAKSMADEMNVPYLGSIPLDPTIGRFCDEGRSIFDAENSSDTTNAILNITSKIKEFCKDKSTLIGEGSLNE